MNNSPLLFLILNLFLFSCKETEEGTEMTDTITYDTIIHSETADTDINIIEMQEGDTLRMSEFQTFGSYITPAVSNENVALYAGIGDSAGIKRVLPILSPVKILEKGGLYYKQFRIDSSQSKPIRKIEYILKTPIFRVEVNGDTGYVSSKDICYYHLKNPDKPIYYFVNVRELTEEIILFKYDISKKRVVDSLSIQLGGSDSEFIPDTVKYRNDIALKNVQGLIEIYRSDEYCGGGQFSIFVIDANDSLNILIRTEASAEMCEGSSVSVSFPTIKNGDTISVINWKRKGLKEKIEKVVKNQKIPVHRIIPKNYFSYDALYDESGEPIIDKDGSCKEMVREDYTLLYFWDGYRLNKLDSVSHLK